MTEQQSIRRLVVAFVWVVIVVVLAVAAKFFLLPHVQGKLQEETGSDSRYKDEIRVNVDSFTGYAVLRSTALKKSLQERGIRLTLKDDAADYDARMNGLADGSVDLAVFTIDSFLTTGAKLGSFPATILMVIDETKGADAIVAYKSGLKSLQDLDDPVARMVLTPRSPSEFLARTVVAHFSLPNLAPQWWIEADGAEDVYNKFRKASKSEKKAYVLWEPFVSKALEDPEAHRLLDSSKLEGYIVDVLVARRQFLKEKPDLVRALVEDYLRATFSCEHRDGGLTQLVQEDLKATGSAGLSAPQIEALVKGIEWKNTLENYGYFGVVPRESSGGPQLLEDMIANISQVLVSTGALSQDPVQGGANTLYYDKLLADLKKDDFHPGRKVNILKGMEGGGGDDEVVHAARALPELKDDQWASLVPVGELKIKPITFARGTARINVQSKRDLEDLAHKLASWPQYYLLVRGNVRKEGDPKANLALASERARATADSLVELGVSRPRVRAEAAPGAGTGGGAQSVSFQLGQVPY